MNQRLEQVVDVETPELVVLSYTIAGLGSRLYAALIDLFICALLFIGVAVGIGILLPHQRIAAAIRSDSSTAFATAALVILQFAILWGYYLLFEGLRDGQTPGKRMLRLRAVRDGGFSVGFAASAVRNLMRIVDLQPIFTYLVGIGSIAFSKSGKRLGDIVAGTIVVRESL
ncbi:MAG TPA: RDD family protein, partial [Gemmatimonadaceae bacterium]|nr:RDD family protein [Gemmatimonadaceae bacterium]